MNKPKWFYAGQEVAARIMNQQNYEERQCVFQVITKDRVIERYSVDLHLKDIEVHIVKQGKNSSVFVYELKTIAGMSTRTLEPTTEGK